MKGAYLKISAICLIIAFLYACKSDNKTNYQKVSGETMGTYYNVTYDLSTTKNIKQGIDSILNEVNLSMSTYINNATISQMNSSMDTLTTLPLDHHLIRVNEKAKEVYQSTNGAYDPTVGPLVNFWGFGSRGRDKKEKVSQSTIDSIRAYVGMDKISITAVGDSMIYYKNYPQTELDFSSIAKGYAVDLLSDYLTSLGSKNHLVDIGGDGYSKGINPTDKPWVIGINRPKEKSAINEFALTVSISNKGLATSGNYRNYYEAGNEKHAHTINPITGQSEFSILGVSIIAQDCMTADAYATACMVLGLEKSQKLISNDNQLEACWMLDADKDGELEIVYSEGFKAFVNQ